LITVYFVKCLEHKYQTDIDLRTSITKQEHRGDSGYPNHISSFWSKSYL